MNKSILLAASFFCLFLSNYQANAQRKIKEMDSDKEKEKQELKSQSDNTFMDKVSFGGNVGATFGNQFTAVLAQPLLFYRLKENTMLGGGFTYIYLSQTVPVSANTNRKISDNVIGLNVFARQQLFNPLFVHAEYNPMNFSTYNRFGQKDGRMWANALYLGGGLQQRFSDRGGYYFMALYDVLWDVNRSFYGTPFDFRVGFFF
jgi:hypothetical protein